MPLTPENTLATHESVQAAQCTEEGEAGFAVWESQPTREVFVQSRAQAGTGQVESGMLLRTQRVAPVSKASIAYASGVTRTSFNLWNWHESSNGFNGGREHQVEHQRDSSRPRMRNDDAAVCFSLSQSA